MRNSRIRPLAEGGILTAIAVVLALIGTYMPFIGVIASLFWPVPIALLGVRHGYKWSILATLIAAILIAVLVHPLQALTIAVGLGLAGIVFGHCFRTSDSPGKILAMGTIACAISNVAVLYTGALATGINPLGGDVEQFKSAIDSAVQVYQQLGMSSEQIASVKTFLDAMLTMMKIAFPALLLISSFFNAWINFWLIRKVLSRFGIVKRNLPRFAAWEVPRAFMWLMTLATIVAWYGEYAHIKLMLNTGVNLIMLGGVAMLVQGLAFIWYLCNKFNVNKLLRVIIIVFVFSNSFFSMNTVLAGIFDSVFEYRKQRPL